MDDFRATQPSPAASAVSPSSLESRAPRIRSDELLRGSRELVIEHRGQEYRLLRTRNDRLILNK